MCFRKIFIGTEFSYINPSFYLIKIYAFIKNLLHHKSTIHDFEDLLYIDYHADFKRNLFKYFYIKLF